jgi:hypothetical protein
VKNEYSRDELRVGKNHENRTNCKIYAKFADI